MLARHAAVPSHVLTIILVVLLVCALAGGGWGHRSYGAVGWSPAAVVLLLLVVLYLTGHLPRLR